MSGVIFYLDDRNTIRHVGSMTDKLETLQADGTCLLKLRNKLRARTGKAGYEKNCEAIKAEIAKLEGTAT